MTNDFLKRSITPYINPKLVVAASNLTVSDAAKVMIDSRVNSVLVFENDKVIGIVTNKDFLNDVVTRGLDSTKITIKEITHKPLITISKDAKINDALELMKKHNIRRLIVTDNSRTIGTISQKKITGDLRDHAVLLPELDLPDTIKCPYCSSEFKDQDSLSSHIDNIHIGKGLFEGNLSQREQLGTINSSDSYPKSV